MGSIKGFLLVLSTFASIISTGAALNFDDENFFNQTADLYDWNNHPCHRECGDNETPLDCYYVFVVEQISSMGKACYDCPNNLTDCFRPHCVVADGMQREIYTVNRLLPGPSIQVCEGDRIVVEVRNRMFSESTTIHWHGIKQATTPYADGVPFVNQCPILPGDTFKYEFNADSSGTYFYHSHSGNQRADGLFGPLVIYPKESKNFLRGLYNADEHIMLITDWSQSTGDQDFVEAFHALSTSDGPMNILVNGLGRQLTTIQDAKKTDTPNYVFHVKQNQKYRFRLIEAGVGDCPIEMSIDKHVLQVVSLDSEDIHPVYVDAITIWPGERVDFILHTNQSVDNYWIRYRGYGLCQTDAVTGVYQGATLRYEGARVEEPTGQLKFIIPSNTNATRVLNPYQKGTESPPWKNINIPQLTSAKPINPRVAGPPDQQIFITFDFYDLDNYDFHRKNLYGYYQVDSDHRADTLQLNHISLQLPSFPLLSQRDQIKPGDLCNASTISKDCLTEQCACTHVIQLGLNNVVELIFIDEGRYGDFNHPLHMHGHFFRVIASKDLEGNVTIDRIKQLDREGKIQRRLEGAPLKDTMKTPGGGYTIVRVLANNPGYWFFHCHFDQHNNMGMALVLKVGENDEMADIPENFPTCGNFV